MLENDEEAIAKANELQGENAFGGPYITAKEVEPNPLGQKVWVLGRENAMLGGATDYITSDGIRFGIPVRTNNAPTIMVDRYNEAKARQG